MTKAFLPSLLGTKNEHVLLIYWCWFCVGPCYFSTLSIFWEKKRPKTHEINCPTQFFLSSLLDSLLLCLILIRQIINQTSLSSESFTRRAVGQVLHIYATLTNNKIHCSCKICVSQINSIKTTRKIYYVIHLAHIYNWKITVKQTYLFPRQVKREKP